MIEFLRFIQRHHLHAKFVHHDFMGIIVLLFQLKNKGINSKHLHLPLPVFLFIIQNLQYLYDFQNFKIFDDRHHSAL